MRDHPAHRLIGEAFRQAGIEQGGQAVLGVLGRPVDEQARRLDIHLHFRQP
jgi:hypothetical protein